MSGSDTDPLDAFFSDVNANEVVKQTLVDSSSDELDNDPVAGIFDEAIPTVGIQEEMAVQKTVVVPLVKNVYVESKEISNLSASEVDDLRTSLGSITIHGLNVPAPVTSWSQCGLPAPVMSLIEHLKFTTPTAIQCQAIPCILSGRDIIGCAVTGSGKTLAFVLPAILHILAQPTLRANEAVCVFLAPTRELAMQTHVEASRFLKLLNMRSTCLVGGNDVEHQLKSLKTGAHLLVGTPGRFIDLMTNNKTFNLGRVGFLVIDEADRMFDLGFEPQVSRIANQLREDRQSMMFSATFPQIVERCARRLLSSPVEIVVGVRNTVTRDVVQNVEVVKADAKIRRLFQLLGEFTDKGQSLVFTNTQEKAEQVFGLLVHRGYRVALLHGGMNQTDRASLIRDFRQRVYDTMVLTSVGSRGLDITSVVLVVNYDAPDHEADYVHRLGRTGRAGNKGWGYTFVEPMEKTNAMEIITALKKSNATIPKELEDMCSASDIKRKWGFGGHGFRFDRTEVTTFKKTRIEQNKAEIDDDQASSDGEPVPGSTPVDDTIRQTTEGMFITEYVINDFPSQVRVNLTTKSNLELVMDESGTKVVQRGVFVVPGLAVPIGERKLYLLIEGATKYSVQVALQNLASIGDVKRGEQAPSRKYKL